MDEYVRILILNNYIEMLKRKNRQKITEFINNPKRIQAFLCALGANEEILELPAHREKIEECLRSMTNSIKEAIRDGDEGIEVKYTENGIEAHREGMKFEEKTNLQFDKNSYEFLKTSNIGETIKKVKGNSDKNIIATYSEKVSLGWPITTTTTLSKERLDKSGFVISKSIEQTDGSKKSKTDITRNGLNITYGENNLIKWNGSPYELNIKSANGKIFCETMSHTIDKYPNSQTYYEGIVGKEFVAQTLETRNKR